MTELIKVWIGMAFQRNRGEPFKIDDFTYDNRYPDPYANKIAVIKVSTLWIESALLVLEKTPCLVEVREYIEKLAVLYRINFNN